MKVGDQVRTPRFELVEIKEVFWSREDAFKNGFREPTHYKGSSEWDVLGKSIDRYCMEFAAVRK